MKHTWEYCGLCKRPMVVCGKCGNICCNGGYGTVDGGQCQECESAYEMQASNEPPEFSESYKAAREKEHRDFWLLTTPREFC